MFAKLLIANRGEIACRIAQVCRQLGVATVGVYSEADAGARHVGEVDEAALVGPPPVRDSYLQGRRILEVAAAHGAEAVHPGYGLLAENADFAEACGRAGMTFVGPRPEVIALMGDKARARAFAAEIGLAVVPGTEGPLGDDEEACREGARLGYPVMVKAVYGGGGIGMARAADERHLRKLLRRARDRAQAAFGRPEVYLEQCVEPARHVEFQVLFDAHGQGVHLYERECSVQRRHQKVVEESPSPLLDGRPELRREMGEAALALCRAAGYSNAGTVEFLVDERRDAFYFLEMNTRLQVEHPVTECVTGIPLVERQIRVAAGEPLALAQDDVELLGAAIECRLYAEDPERQYLPQPGLVGRLVWPEGPGLRVDTGIREGDVVTPYYDPLLAKIVAYGSSRAMALARMERALEALEVVGVATNRNLLLRVLRHEDFAAGRLHTGLLAGL